MSKQDRQGVRTINDLERKYIFDRAFSEVMGVAKDAQTTAQKTAEGVKAELSLVIKRDDNNQIVSMLNASANVIKLKGNRVSIESDNFTLTEDGKITAKNGVFDSCEIKETCQIYGVLKAKTISSIYDENLNCVGNISFDTGNDFSFYTMTAQSGTNKAGVQIGIGAPYLGATPGVHIYSSRARGTFNEDGIDLYSGGTFALECTNGTIAGTWLYNGNEIATLANITALDARLKALEGA